MPRKTRIDAPGSLHHIICRGIERRSIFRKDTDKDDFITRLSRTLMATRTPLMKGDERILGDSDFVLQVLEGQKEQMERRFRLREQGYDFEKAVERVSKLL